MTSNNPKVKTFQLHKRLLFSSIFLSNFSRAENPNPTAQILSSEAFSKTMISWLRGDIMISSLPSPTRKVESAAIEIKYIFSYM